jgi:hypothetical protein
MSAPTSTASGNTAGATALPRKREQRKTNMKKICLLLALLYAPFAGAEYKCVDERGLTHIGDIPPAGCANVVMYEISRSGSVLRKIDPTPTPEQVKARLEEFERTKATDRMAGEQKRKDMALLNTYSSERELDVARDRNIDPIRSRIKSSEERLVAVDKRLKEIQDEMEFYKAGKSRAIKDAKDGARSREAPHALLAELERVQSEKQSLTAAMASQEKEIDGVRAKFDADKKRWLALKSPPAGKPVEFVPADSKTPSRQVHRAY